MKLMLLVMTMTLANCATVREHPLTPYSCDYEGGINLTNAKMLHVEEMRTSANRPNWFDGRKTVFISGQHFSLQSFQPIMMCIDPELSAQIDATTTAAGDDVERRYAVIAGAFVLFPMLPIAAAVGPVASVVVGASGTFSAIAGWLHQKFWEPNVEKLNQQVESFNYKLAERLRQDNRSIAFRQQELQKKTALLQIIE